MKRTLALTLLLLASTSSVKPSSYITVKNVGLLAGIGIASYAIAPHLYNYLFPLSDAQEIEQAREMLTKVEITYNDIAFMYQNEENIIDAYADASNSSDIIDLLTPEITAKQHNSFYAYVQELDKEINKLKDIASKLAAKKITLMQRKTKIRNNDTLSAAEIAELYSNYNDVLTTMGSLQSDGHELQLALVKIRTYVTNSNIYIMQAQNARIQELELQVYNASYYNNHHHCDSTWYRPVYVETTTPVTAVSTPVVQHVTVNQCNTITTACPTPTSTPTHTASPTPCQPAQTTYVAPTPTYEPSITTTPVAAPTPPSSSSSSMVFDTELWKERFMEIGQGNL